MPIKHFLVDVSLLGQGMTGVQIYAINFARYLERSFDCHVLSPRHLASNFMDPVECGDPPVFRNSIVARGHMSRAARSIVRSSRTFIYCPYMRGFLRQRNQVITIHDLIAHYYPTRNPIERTFDRYLLPRLARRVKGVFTVSQTVRTEIAGFYKVPAERLHVVPSGLDLSKWCPAALPLNQTEPYLLVVSANRPYKNTTELLQHHRLWATRYRLRIVSTRARYGGVLRAAVRELGLEEKVDFLDDLREPEIIRLYQHCAAVIYPSLMEGFGRPALEGMAVGRPVILSDITVHKESFGEAAVFVTPGEPTSWERAFRELIDPALITSKTNKGLEIARGYTLENSWQRLKDALIAVEPHLQELQKGGSDSPADLPVRT